MASRIKISTRYKLKEASKSNSGRFHVVPTSKGWSVKKEGAKRAISTSHTKDSAVRVAKARSSKDGKIVIHKKDGTIQFTTFQE